MWTWGPFVARRRGCFCANRTDVRREVGTTLSDASAIRIPVRVTTAGAGKRRLKEQTVIEFGTAHEVLFSSSLPLEFEDRVRLVNSDGSFDARATVVAVRYHGGGKAVAARFVGEVGNWIIKP